MRAAPDEPGCPWLSRSLPLFFSIVRQACAGGADCPCAQQHAELSHPGLSRLPAVLQQAQARSRPRVCSDMMSRVARRASAYNNAAGVADSWPRTAAKLGYYQALKLAYGFAGRCTQARRASALRQAVGALGTTRESAPAADASLVAMLRKWALCGPP